MPDAGLWPFNEGSGTTVFDLSGNGYTGILTSIDWGAGKFGSSLISNANTDKVAIPSFPLLLPPLTIVVWANTSSSSANKPPLVGSGSYWDANTNFVLGVSSQAYPHFHWRGGDNLYGDQTATDYSSEIQNKWYQLVGVMKSNYDAEIFLNGRSILTDSGNSAPTSSGQALRFFSCTNNYECQGHISHVMIFSRALSSFEIALLYREPFCMFERDPIELWVGSVGAGAPPAGIPIFRRRRAG